MVQAGTGGVMVWGIFSWHTLGPLVPIEHCLNVTAYCWHGSVMAFYIAITPYCNGNYFSIVADHVHPFMTTVYTSSDVLPAG